MEFRKRGSWIRSLIFFIVDNGIEFLAIASIVCAIAFLNVFGLILVIPIIIVAWLLFNVIEIRETLLQIEENTTNFEPPTLADDEKNCPFCDSIIKKVAKKCKFCGQWLEDDKEGVQQ